MEASSVPMGKLADIVLHCTLAQREEPELGGVPFFNTAFPPGGPFVSSSP